MPRRVTVETSDCIHVNFASATRCALLLASDNKLGANWTTSSSFIFSTCSLKLDELKTLLNRDTIIS